MSNVLSTFYIVDFVEKKGFCVVTFYGQKIKYCKRRIGYSTGHPGSYTPVIITNKEAQMIFGNMNKESGGSSQTANTGKKRVTRISDYFSKSGKPTISGTDRPDTTPDYTLVTN